MSTPLAYLDASAAVKLVVPEAGSSSLAAELASIRSWVSSEILEVEVMCVLRRTRGRDGVDLARKTLGRIDHIALSPEVRNRACADWTPPQRALDAIHLATALHLAIADLAFYTYDRDQAAAGRAAGLDVRSPGA